MGYTNDTAKNEILEASKRVFQRWGFKKTTMDDIARESGKAKSSLYYYFKSKDDIIDALLDREFESIIQKARENALQQQTAKEMLKKYIVESIVAMKNEITQYTIIWDEIKRDQNLITKLRDKFQSVEEQYIEEILHIGFKNKEFSFISAQELTTAAKAITGMIHALELYLLLENDDIKQVDIAARFITNGI
ncbi:MAG: TetR/AcrR family transcriptional regulator [Bacteroidetes bacterium]|nr:TetR/AcrR family transcriptional regulator [Bacteroidota bacterium]